MKERGGTGTGKQTVCFVYFTSILFPLASSVFHPAYSTSWRNKYFRQDANPFHVQRYYKVRLEISLAINKLSSDTPFLSRRKHEK